MMPSASITFIALYRMMQKCSYCPDFIETGYGKNIRSFGLIFVKEHIDEAFRMHLLGIKASNLLGLLWGKYSKEPKSGGAQGTRSWNHKRLPL